MTSEGTPIDGYDMAQSQMMQEKCILVNEEDDIIGSETKLSVHSGDGFRHRAFSVLIYDSKGRLLVQKRSSDKITFPNVWANSCCSRSSEKKCPKARHKLGAGLAAISELGWC